MSPSRSVIIVDNNIIASWRYNFCFKNNRNFLCYRDEVIIIIIILNLLHFRLRRKSADSTVERWTRGWSSRPETRAPNTLHRKCIWVFCWYALKSPKSHRLRQVTTVFGVLQSSVEKIYFDLFVASLVVVVYHRPPDGPIRSGLIVTVRLRRRFTTITTVSIGTHIILLSTIHEYLQNIKLRIIPYIPIYNYYKRIFFFFFWWGREVLVIEDDDR